MTHKIKFIALIALSVSSIVHAADTVTIANSTYGPNNSGTADTVEAGGSNGQLGTKKTDGVQNYNVRANSGSRVVFSARQRVVLRPGFRAYTGSQFLAMVDSDWDGYSDQQEASGFYGSLSQAKAQLMELEFSNSSTQWRSTSWNTFTHSGLLLIAH
ncbi:MAG: hypothetical protein MK130_07325 [Puniceicoccaceae bacterium]|nr:hypothetical protein [Puniceicoccaceae bacterium]NRA27005.1 hypothetical protein [Opitutales bacterium]